MIRIGVIGIVLKAEKDVINLVQNTISSFAEIIQGRMGIPDKETGINTISLIVKGTNEQISALTGKLGKIKDVSVKSAVVTMEA